MSDAPPVFGSTITDAVHTSRLRPESDLPAIAEQCIGHLNEHGTPHCL